VGVVAWICLHVKMAVESLRGTISVFVLLFATGVLAYYYWDASSSSASLLVEMQRLTRRWSTANSTISTLRYELHSCKAQA